MSSKPVITFVLSALVMGLAACSSSSTSTPTPTPLAQNLYAVDFNSGKLYVYPLPASAASMPTVTVATGFTALYDAEFDSSGMLWVDNDLNPSIIYGYMLPLTSASVPAATVNMTGTNNALSFTFDPTGTLWVVDDGNGALLGFHGPFTGVSTPAAFADIAITAPANVISDSSGDLYVAANDHVVRLNAPPTTINANLSPLTQPIAMLLDTAGNLYVGDFANGNLYRYNAPVSDGATPAITDLQATSALIHPYYMALDHAGNLYISDCSSTIKVYATASFSATSAPAYTLPFPGGTGCSTGLAVR